MMQRTPVLGEFNVAIAAMAVFWFHTGVKFSICNEIYQGWSIENAFEHAAQTGYDAVEVAPFTLAKSVTDVSPAERVRIREATARAGIEICGIHWVLVQVEGMYLNHPDRAVRNRTSGYFCDLVDFCADLGGKVVVVGSPKQRNILPGLSAQDAWQLAAETFRDSVKRAEDRGVTICFEPLGPAETDFINTAAEAIRFVQQFGSPAMKIILDCKAMSSESQPIAEIIRTSWPHFAHFHANDANLKGPGFGATDFKPIASALKEVGYSGCVSVEVFKFEEGPEAIASQSLAHLQRVFA